MVKEYLITFVEGIDKSEFYSEIGNIVYDYPHRPKLLIAELSNEQKEALENNQNVKFIHDYTKLKESSKLSECATKSVSYIRRKESVTPNDKLLGDLGNWGLIRHQSATNTMSTDTSTTGTYEYDYDGDGVDLILNLGSVLQPNDPEFMTGSTSRVQQFQWNTLTGMSNIPTVNYTVSNLSVNNHAEAVAYLCASNTYGWATGANIYIWPRNQMVNAAGQDQTEEWGWDCMRLFHENKIANNNTRPTIVVDAMGYKENNSYLWDNDEALFYRGVKYETLNPGGSGDMPVQNVYRSSQVNASTVPYGFLMEQSFASSGLYWVMDKPALTNPANPVADLMTYANTLSNDGHYANRVEPLEDMIAAGVHHVSAAGNEGTPMQLPGHPDYNNCIIRGTYGSSNYTYMTFYNRPMNLHASDTIVCASMASEFGASFGFSGKEILAGSSNRGGRVDCAAAGDDILLDLGANGTYNASGTSFASPQIGGMACLVLEKYPTTTPAQLRKYFRDEAVGTDTLHDTGKQPAISSKYGDTAYNMDYFGLKGYSGNIAYLDHELTFNPTTITDTTVTNTVTAIDNEIDYTTAEINTKLATIT